MPRQRPDHGDRVVHRTARVELRLTHAQRERCFGLLRRGGDLWAPVLELNALRRRRGDAPVVGHQALGRDLSRAASPTRRPWPASRSNESTNGGPAPPTHGVGSGWPNPRADGSPVHTADWWPTETWWEPSTSPREGLGAEEPLTPWSWRSCTVEPAGTCPDGPGVTHGGWRWTTIVTWWVPGRLWPVPRNSGSRSSRPLRRLERGTSNLGPD